MSRLLEVENLTKTFVSGERLLTVLEDVTFSLEDGDSCAIVGPSGSGKTTLLGLCAGLDDPTRGRVRLCSEELAALSEDQRARLRNRCVGFVFQSFRLIPTLTALENVMVPAELRGSPTAAADAERLLDRVGLGDRLGHYPVQLSGGEKQRVGIARAFINRPQILFADEPTGNLDVDTGHAVIDLLFELNETAGTALVIVTHDVELASRCARLIRLRGGRVESDSGRPVVSDTAAVADR